MSVIQEFKDYVFIGGVRISKRRPSFDDAMAFERRVAAIFRSLGADVEHNTSLAGTQIDILVSEPSKTGTTIRSAVECKALSSPVTVDGIIAFSGVALFLRNRGLIDKALVVSLSGFTEEARTAAAEHSIDLVELADLERRMRGREAGFEAAKARQPVQAPLKVVDLIKRGLYSVEEGQKRKAVLTGKSQTVKGKASGDVRTSFVDSIDAQLGGKDPSVNPYFAARKVSQGFEQDNSAFHLGRQYGKHEVESWRRRCRR